MTFIADFFLFFLHAPFLVPFFLLGYFCLNKEIFSRALFIYLFTLILGQYLKSLWQVPLPPHLGEGWAYPSGHMLAAMALYGWLAVEFRNRWINLSILLGLVGIGWSLVFMGYHSSEDVVAGVFFGAMEIIFYGLLCRYLPRPYHPLIGLFLVVPAVALILLNPRIISGLWYALTGLGVCSILIYFDKWKEITFRKEN